MNEVRFNISDEIRGKIEEIAASKGVSVQTLLAEVTATMVEQFEVHKLFLEMAKQGEGEVEEALELLRR